MFAHEAKRKGYEVERVKPTGSGDVRAVGTIAYARIYDTPAAPPAWGQEVPRPFALEKLMRGVWVHCKVQPPTREGCQAFAAWKPALYRVCHPARRLQQGCGDVPKTGLRTGAHYDATDK